MRLLSATDVAIARAIEAGTLALLERPSRVGGTAVYIVDEEGLIEVALDRAEAEARIASIKGRMA